MSRSAAAVIDEMQAYAASVGMALTSQCARFKPPLYAPTNLHHHLGTARRTKTINDGPGSLAKEHSGTVAISTRPIM